MSLVLRIIDDDEPEPQRQALDQFATLAILAVVLRNGAGLGQMIRAMRKPDRIEYVDLRSHDGR